MISYLAKVTNPTEGIQNPILEPNSGQINYGIPFFQAFLPKIVTLTLIIAAIIFIFVILVGGISWMLAGSDKNQIESARGRVVNGIIGFLIVLSVFAIATLIEVLFGIDILALDLGILIVE